MICDKCKPELKKIIDELDKEGDNTGQGLNTYKLRKRIGIGEIYEK